MDLATITERGKVVYFSEVTSDGPEQVERLYERVREWTLKISITLGEGTVETQDYLGDGAYSHTLVLKALVISGDTNPRSDELFGVPDANGQFV